MRRWHVALAVLASCVSLRTGRVSIVVAILSVTIPAVCGGCGEPGMAHYEAVGPSAEPYVLQNLSIRLPMDFVYVKAASQTVTDERMTRDLESIVEEAIRERPGSPAFRSLCAILNRHFGKWERLIIIERIGFADHGYGYAALAVTYEGIQAVTNLEPDGRNCWVETPRPRALALPPGRMRQCLAEMDKARRVLPERLLWFEAVDWPLYVLHDVRADGDAFSFAICGWGDKAGESNRASEVAPDYVQAAQLINKAKPWAAAADGSPRAAELRSAGRTYAALLASVWESILGKADFYILGEAGQKEAGPTPSLSVVP